MIERAVGHKVGFEALSRPAAVVEHRQSHIIVEIVGAALVGERAIPALSTHRHSIGYEEAVAACLSDEGRRINAIAARRYGIRFYRNARQRHACGIVHCHYGTLLASIDGKAYEGRNHDPGHTPSAIVGRLSVDSHQKHIAARGRSLEGEIGIAVGISRSKRCRGRLRLL